MSKQIIAAAIRNAFQIGEAAMVGAHCLTAGYSVFQDSFRNPCTTMGETMGEEVFQNAWDATPAQPSFYGRPGGEHADASGAPAGVPALSRRS